MTYQQYQASLGTILGVLKDRHIKLAELTREIQMWDSSLEVLQAEWAKQNGIGI